MSTAMLKVAVLVIAILGLGAGGLAATSTHPLSNGSGETIVAPHRLNLESHGNFVTAILKNATALPAGLKASDLTATASVSVNGVNVPVDAVVRAYNGTSHIVVVKIDRQQINAAVEDALSKGGTVADPLTLTVTVSGGGASVTRTGTIDWFRHP